MPSNIEIKARLNNFERTFELASRLSDEPCQIIFQEDVFFNSPRGRLKLRKFPDGTGELIYYERPDSEGPKQSNYNIARICDADEIQNILEPALGLRAVVKKKRNLFMSGRTRIHIDEVELLGAFLELEVVLAEGESYEEGYREARRLMVQLEISPPQLISGAYIDLLSDRK